MKLISFALLVFLLLPSLYAFQQHDSSLSYTHPAIVVSGGVSYISVKNVDAGINIDSPEYWKPLLSTAPSTDPGDPPATEDPTGGNPRPDDRPNPLNDVRLSGISTRGPISLNNAMTGGILIEGNEDKKVVFMAKGYSMFVSDKVENYAEDLEMVIYSWNDSDEKWEYQGEYDDWGDVTNSATESGAIVENISTIETSKNPEITLLQDEKEVGVVLTLPPGYHAAIVNSKSSLIQEGIVEVYEVKDSNVESNSALTGISTRGPVSDTNAMTGGILIEGNEDKKVVFMAKGYSMFVSDKVENYAEDLEMVIYSWNDSDEKWEYQGKYDDWGDVTNSATESGALVENISTIETSKNPEITLLQDEKEAGVVLTLPPGYHAAIVSSKSSSLQEGIVEAYEVK